MIISPGGEFSGIDPASCAPTMGKGGHSPSSQRRRACCQCHLQATADAFWVACVTSPASQPRASLGASLKAGGLDATRSACVPQNPWIPDSAWPGPIRMVHRPQRAWSAIPRRRQLLIAKDQSTATRCFSVSSPTDSYKDSDRGRTRSMCGCKRSALAWNSATFRHVGHSSW